VLTVAAVVHAATRKLPPTMKTRALRERVGMLNIGLLLDLRMSPM
jgi:hypothetical protein